MARQQIEVRASVQGQEVVIRIADFPIIEDLVSQLIIESIVTRRQGEAMSSFSSSGRDVKDFLIKTNVVRG
jgi:hypothetical protein